MTQVLSQDVQHVQAAQIIRFAEHYQVPEYADWYAKDQALKEAEGELQEARGRLRAAELGEEADEVRAIVGVRRAERWQADAQRRAQAAWEALVPAAVHHRNWLMYERMREFNARGREYQAAYAAELKRINDQADAQGRELDRWRVEHILPLVELGAPESRRVESTGLYAIDE